MPRTWRRRALAGFEAAAAGQPDAINSTDRLPRGDRDGQARGVGTLPPVAGAMPSARCPCWRLPRPADRPPWPAFSCRWPVVSSLRPRLGGATPPAARCRAAGDGAAAPAASSRVAAPTWTWDPVRCTLRPSAEPWSRWCLLSAAGGPSFPRSLTHEPSHRRPDVRRQSVVPGYLSWPSACSSSTPSTPSRLSLAGASVRVGLAAGFK